MVVQFENVCFGYNRKKQILKDINLTLPSGKFIAILGPNGCGKTTTVKQINQILKAQSGRVLVDGKAVQDMTPLEIAPAALRPAYRPIRAAIRAESHTSPAADTHSPQA